jgi:steroid delta-isomerase-like uncharacterized protein
MTHDDAVKLFEHHQESWNAGDAERLAGDYTEDGTIISPIFHTVHGKSEILDSFRTLFATFPDWRYTGLELLVDGDRIAQPFAVKATHSREFLGIPGSGRPFDIEGVRLFEMRDGLIAHERRYYDFTGLLIQLGILRSKPARI